MNNTLSNEELEKGLRLAEQAKNAWWGDRLAYRVWLANNGERLIRELLQLRHRTDYLIREINFNRRVMQDAGTWEAFCSDYAAYKERRAALVVPAANSCPDCGGRGWVMEPGPERDLPNQIPCEQCYGTGGAVPAAGEEMK